MTGAEAAAFVAAFGAAVERHSPELADSLRLLGAVETQAARMWLCVQASSDPERGGAFPMEVLAEVAAGGLLISELHRSGVDVAALSGDGFREALSSPAFKRHAAAWEEPEPAACDE